MSGAAVAISPRTIRWVVALAIPVVCLSLMSAIVGRAPGSVETLHALALAAMALAAYAWSVYPAGASAAVSFVVLLCLLWALVARGAWALKVDASVFVLLVAVAVWHRRSRARRLLRLAQVLGDIEEEQVVKQQAITLATQSRDALQKKSARYLQLQSIAEELANMIDLTAIGRLVVERAFALIGKSDVCLLFLVDQQAQGLSLFASKKREELPVIREKHGDQFDRFVLRTHRPLLVSDTRRDFRFTVALGTDRPVSSVIACPIFLGPSPEGVLRLDSAQPGAYTQDDLRFLEILLGLVSTAMTNAKLFVQTQQLAMTDGLTGLMLRRPFLRQLTRELARAGRSHEPAAVFMCDVDHFKTYNDTYGHTAGDRLLATVAEALRTVAPPGSAIARYGGEEFAVLLPRLSRAQAAVIAEKIRKVVGREGEETAPGRAARASDAAGQPRSRRELAQVTISIGVAAFPDDAQADLELIRVADQRLYRAKRDGRNRVSAE